jgi:hypothetical protein
MCDAVSSIMYTLHMSEKKPDSERQRELNDLQRTRLSRRRMIWLLSHPLHTLSRLVSLSQSSCVLPVELTEGRGGEVVGEEPDHTMTRSPGPL